MPRGMGGQSPSNIAHYLKGINFPCNKQDIVDYAEDNNAPDEIVQVIEDLPDQEYSSMADLMQGVGQIE
ncbi:MAG: DUF2795 domain-containing protein [Armatimonadota bacterium]|nr:DUF2795 domain-containing protein [bacterium]